LGPKEELVRADIEYTTVLSARRTP